MNWRRYSWRFGLLVLLLLLGILANYGFVSRAGVAKFYPVSCLGGWENPQAAEGEPDGSSAVLKDALGEIFCGGFKGDIPTDSEPKKFVLKFAWTISEEAATTTTITGQKFENQVNDIIATSSSEGVSLTITDATSTVPTPEGVGIPDSVNGIGTTSSPDVIPTLTPPPALPEGEGAITNTSPLGGGGEGVGEVNPPAPPEIAPTEAPAPASEPTSWLGKFFNNIAWAQDASTDSTSSPQATTAAAVLAAADNFVSPDEVLEVFYTLDSTNWQSLGRVKKDNWSNLALTLPIKNWSDLSKLQISVRRLPTFGEPATVKLDSVWLEVEYANPFERELTPEEIALLPRVNLPGTEVFIAPQNDFRADESPNFGINTAVVVPEATSTPVESALANHGASEASPVPFSLPALPDLLTASTSTTTPLLDLPEKLLNLLKPSRVIAASPDGTVGASGKWRVLKAEVFDPAGKPSDIKPVVDDSAPEPQINLPKPSNPPAGGFRPGKYRIHAEILVGRTVVVSDLDFTWGVLAINVNKSIYAPDEKAYLQMAVLNDGGHTICDANLELKINGQAVEISQSKTCGPNNVTDNPDYFAYYRTGSPGTYKMELTDLTTGHRISDAFLVKADETLAIERIGATRINPFKADYTMRLRVRAERAFSGTVTEQVPKEFEIITPQPPYLKGEELTWPVDLKAGETQEFSYTYHAPPVSPQIYLLGPAFAKATAGEPASGVTFEEARQWQIASDNACTSTGGGGNWTASGSWTSCGGTTPQAADTVTILNGDTITLDTSPTVSTIDIQNGGTLTNDSNARTLTLGGTSGTLFTLGATGTFTPSTFITVTMSPAASITTTSGTITFYDLNLAPTLGSSVTYTMGSGALTINGNLNVKPVSNGSSLTVFTVTVGAAITVSSTKTINVIGNGDGSLFQRANPMFNMNGFAVSAGFIIQGESGQDTNNQDTITLGASTLTLTGTSGTLWIKNTGLINVNSSTVVMNPDASVVLTSGSVKFNKLQLTPTLTAARTYTFGTTAVTCAGNYDINPTSTGANALTVNMGAGNTVAATATTTIKGSGAGPATSSLSTNGSANNLSSGHIDVQSTGTLTASSTVTLTGSAAGGILFTNNGTATLTSSTVVMNPNVSVVLTSGTFTFNTLQLTPTITAARTYTFGSGALTINGAFTIQPGTAANLLTVNMGANITVAATQTTTITRTTSATSNLSTTASNYSLSTGLLSIAAGGTLTANGSTITLTKTSGTLFTNNGTFTANTSTVVMNPDAAITAFSGTFTGSSNALYKLQFSPSLTAARTYTMGTAASTTNNFDSLPSGDGSTRILTITMSGGITVATSTSGTFTASSTNVNGRTTLNTTSGSNYPIDAGLLAIGTNSILTANASVITLTGTSGTLFAQAGTFTQGTSEVKITGASGTPNLLSTATTFHKLTINAAATAINDGAAITINNAANAKLYVQAGVFNANNAISGPGGSNGTLQIDSGGTLCLGGTASGTTATCDSAATATTARTMPTFQTYTFDSASTVRYLSDAATTISSTPTYGKLQLAPVATAARIYTFATGAATINGNFDINPGTAANLLTVNMNANVTVAATATTTITRTTSATSNLSTNGQNNLSSGHIDVQTGGTLTSTSTVTLTGTATGSTLFTRTGTATLTSANVIMNPDADVTLTSGTFAFGALNLTPTITAARTYTFGSGAVEIGNNFDINPSAASANLLTVNMGANITVDKGTTITRTTSATSNLSTTASNYSLSTTVLSIDAGGTLTANGSTITLRGSPGTLFTNNGTFTANTSTVIVNPDADITVFSGTFVGANAFYKLQLTPTITSARTYTFGGVASTTGNFDINPTSSGANALTVNLGGWLDVAATATTTITRTTSATSNLVTNGQNNISSGHIDVQTGGTLTASSTVTLTGTDAGGVLATRTGTGTYTLTSSTVIMNPDVSVKLTSGAITFNILQLTPTITSARTYTFGSGAVEIGNNFDINPSAASANKGLLVNMAAAIAVDKRATTTITGSGAGSATSTLDTISGSNYGLSSGYIDIQSGGTLKANGSTITLRGSPGTLFTNNGTFTANTSTVIVNPDADITVFSGTFVGANAFYQLQLTPDITSNRTYTFGGAASTTGNFDISPSGDNRALTVNLGGWLDVAPTATITVTSQGTDIANLDTTASNYQLNSGHLDIESTGSLTANASTITLTGTDGTLFSNTGTFSEGTSTTTVASLSGTPTLLSSPTIFYILNINSAATVINAGADIYTDDTAGNKLYIQSGVFNTEDHIITPGADATLQIDSGGTLCLGGTTAATNATCDSDVTQVTGTSVMPSFATFNLNSASTVSYLDDKGEIILSAPTYGNLKLNPNLGGYSPTYTPDGALTIAGNFTINPSSDGADTLTVQSDYGITVADTATTTITGSGVGPASSNLLLSSTLNTGNMDIDANGTLMLPGGYNINVSGNWTNQGTLDSSSGTVNFNGTGGQLIHNSTTFYSLTANTTAARTLTFDAGATTTIAAGGSATFQGAASQLLTLQSSVASSNWNFAIPAGSSRTVDYTAGIDANASDSSISATNSTCTRTTNWSCESTLTMSIDGSTEQFPSLTPGTLVATSSILGIKTDNPSGFFLTVKRDNAAATLLRSGDTSVSIPDKTNWSPGVATTSPGNSTASSTEPLTLQFRIRSAGTDTPNYASVWWGTDDTTASALFAGLPSTDQTIVNRSTAAAATTTVQVLYNVNVPATQKSGAYSGDVIYTVTVNP